MAIVGALKIAGNNPNRKKLPMTIAVPTAERAGEEKHSPTSTKKTVHRLNRLRKKAENCHSERRVCAKNPSWSFVFNREGFFASLRMTTKALFPQPVKPVLLKMAIHRNAIRRSKLISQTRFVTHM
jgi:hypothetical protein